MDRTKAAGALMLASLLALGVGQAGTSKPTPYTMTGVVVNSSGQPVEGARVFADNTLYHNMNAIGYTDAEGRSTTKLPKNEIGTWAPGAYVNRNYHSVTYEFRLCDDNNRAFATAEGVIWNFVWRLSGELPDGDGFLGEKVLVSSGEGVTYDQKVEVILTLDGPWWRAALANPSPALWRADALRTCR